MINAAMLIRLCEGNAATDFNGTTQYLTHADPTGFVDSNKFTLAMTLRRDTTAVDPVFHIGSGANNRFAVGYFANKFTLSGFDAAGTNLVVLAGTATVTDTAWRTWLCSVDLSDTNKRHLYLGDTVDPFSSASPYIDGSIDFTGTNYYVARSRDATAYYNGALCGFWFHAGVYIDLSVKENRRKLLTANGPPAFRGEQGQKVIGIQPMINLRNGRTQTGSTAAFSPIASPTAVDGPYP